MEATARLLIIDDERIALRNLEHVMKKEGYDVTGTQSGPNALKLLEEQRFEVVLTDLRMDNMDGIGLLKELHSRWPALRVPSTSAGPRPSATGASPRRSRPLAVGGCHRPSAR